jgi:hypothetical protein
MLVDWLLDFLHMAVGKFFSVIRSAIPAPPAWLTQGSDFIHTVMGYVGALDSWVPMSIALPITLFVVVALVAGLVIKVARIVASFLTLGGGSAA